MMKTDDWPWERCGPGVAEGGEGHKGRKPAKKKICLLQEGGIRVNLQGFRAERLGVWKKNSEERNTRDGAAWGA